MSNQGQMDQPGDFASKVLRRAHVSKMTRALQNSLALANVKFKHGWENLSLDTIEPHINQEFNNRKRPASSNDTISDSSSSISDHFSSVQGLGSSPLTAPLFSDENDRLGSSRSNKRQRVVDLPRMPASSSRAGRKSRNAATVSSWKKSHSLPESSPVFHRQRAQFSASAHVSRLSFISEGSTVPDERASPELSEDDDTDLPVHSFHAQTSQHIQSSPPRTPPSQRRLVNSTRAANVSWSRTPRNGEEGADLLMFLAASPTPANAGKKTIVHVPSTPPSKHTPLPSSMMSTPGGSGLFGFMPNTPSNNFNFSDFCNVTPSPAQGHWQKTPATSKTPLVASSARRKLNFDALLPPTASPNVTRSAGRRESGLGMDLGGELVS